MNVRVGREAPDFSSADDTGNRIRLTDLRGSPVVIHFFVLAWTGV